MNNNSKKYTKEEERQIFTGYRYVNVLENISKSNSGKDIRVNMMFDRGDEVTAYTDGRSITINADGEFLFDEKFKLDTNLKSHMIYGLLNHELGHVNYTDFMIHQGNMKSLQSGMIGSIFGEGTSLRNKMDKGLITWLENKPHAFTDNFTGMYANLDNILEDGYIEPQMLYMTSGRLKDGLGLLRSIFFSQQKSVEELVKSLVDNQQKTPHPSLLLEGELNKLDDDYTVGDFEEFLLIQKFNLYDAYDDSSKYFKLLDDTIEKINKGSITVNNLKDEFKNLLDEVKKVKDTVIIKDFINSKGQELNILFALMLTYGKYDVIIYEEEGSLDHPLIKRFINLTKLVQESVSEHNPIKRDVLKKEVAVAIQKEMVGTLMESKDDIQGMQNFMDQMSEMLEELGSSDQIQKGNSRGNNSGSSRTVSRSKAIESDEKTEKAIKSSDDAKEEESSKDDEEGQAGSKGADEESTDESKGAGEGDEKSDEDSENSDGTGNGDDKSDEEGNETDSEGEYGDEEGSDKKDGSREEVNSKAEGDSQKEKPTSEMEGLVESSAEPAMTKEDYILTRLDSKATAQEITSILSSIRKESSVKTEGTSANVTKSANDKIKSSRGRHPHGGIQVDVINRSQGVSPSNLNERKRVYLRDFEAIKDISKKTNIEVRKILENRKAASKAGARYTGNKLQMSKVYRRDKKIFSPRDNSGKFELPLITLLVDQSGSMNGSRMNYARRTVMLFQEFCLELGIPFNVYGHCEPGYHTEFNIFVDDKSFKKGDQYSVVEMQPGGSNRDGLALRVSYDRMVDQPQRKKILMIISDGRPNSSTGDYNQTGAYRDIRGCVKEYEDKGIETIACAIGDDVDVLRDIYGADRLLDCTDLETLPKQVAQLLRKAILGK